MKILAVTAVATASTVAPMIAVSQTLPVISETVLNAYPTYSGDDLELTVDANGTHFRLWSPGAQAV